MNYRTLAFLLLSALTLQACSSSGPASHGDFRHSRAADGMPDPVPMRLMADLQRDFGLPRQAAAGIVGNLAHESGNFLMLKEIEGTCYGYSQWCGSRKREFYAFAPTVGGKTSYAANYGFLKHELETDYPKLVTELQRTRNVKKAASRFMTVFLRPAKRTTNLPRRINFGKQFLSGNYSGSGCVQDQLVNRAGLPTSC